MKADDMTSDSPHVASVARSPQARSRRATQPAGSFALASYSCGDALVG